jgi:hypothetical protein
MSSISKEVFPSNGAKEASSKKVASDSYDHKKLTSYPRRSPKSTLPTSEPKENEINSPFFAAAPFDSAQAIIKAISQFVLPGANANKKVFTNLNFVSVHDVIEINADGKFPAVLAYIRARERIIARAISMGYSVEDLSGGDISNVPGGFFGHFPNHDIYTSNDGSIFEVYGDIRAKYNALGGATGLLGFPTTDETGTPDGIGRFNHFTNGSIYWTPRTGPMSVRGNVRDSWAASGWERGPMGYPVEDQHRMIPIPASDPIVEWCRFENGVVAGDPKGGKIAPAATISLPQLQAMIGGRINDQFKASPDNVALHSGMEFLGVSDWRYGFWASVSRAVGFRLHGFHDNGLATDTDFSIDIWLRFELCWSPSFTEPVDKTLVAILDFLRVKAEGGLPLGAVISGVTKAIHESFYLPGGPDPSQPEVPDGAVAIQHLPTGANLRTGEIDLLDVLVSSSGDLQFFVNPLAPPKMMLDFFDFGHERQRQFQDKLDSI